MKFTEAGEVSSRSAAVRQSDMASLHFAGHDTGCGIPADRQDRLFRAFSQVDASTTRRYGGTGLGLAISKKLTEIMGGRIWFESECDKGSVFQFVIPLRPASAPPVRHTPRHIDTTLAKQRPLRILLAGHVVTQKVVVAQLKRMGYNPTWSPTIGSADPCTGTLRRDYDGVQMPERDGWRRRAVMDEFEPPGGAPDRVTAMSQERKVRCMAAGIYGFSRQTAGSAELRDVAAMRTSQSRTVPAKDPPLPVKGTERFDARARGPGSRTPRRQPCEQASTVA